MEDPFPTGAKLGDKKELKLIRTLIHGDEAWNAVGCCKAGGIGPFKFDITHVENALVGIADENHKKAAYDYWAHGPGGWMAVCVRAICDSLVKMAAQDSDSKEAVQSLKTIKFELTVVDKKVDWEKAFTMSVTDDLLTVKCTMSYIDGWPAALGDGSNNKVVQQLVALF
jgi:hypothetical protein